MIRGVDDLWPYVDELFRDDAAHRPPRRAASPSRPSSLRAGFDARHRDGARRGGAGACRRCRSRAGRRPPRAALRAPRLPPRRDAGARPRSIRGRPGDAMTDVQEPQAPNAARPPPGAGLGGRRHRVDPEIPVLTSRPRRAARRSRVDDDGMVPRQVTITPTYSRLPRHGRHPRRPDARARRRRATPSVRRASSSLVAGLDHRLDEDAGKAKLQRVRHRAAHRPLAPPARRPGPALAGREVPAVLAR